MRSEIGCSCISSGVRKTVSSARQGLSAESSRNISGSTVRLFIGLSPNCARMEGYGLMPTPSPSREIFARRRNMLQMRLMTIPFRSRPDFRAVPPRQVRRGISAPRSPVVCAVSSLSQMRQMSFSVFGIILSQVVFNRTRRCAARFMPRLVSEHGGYAGPAFPKCK